MSSEMFFSSVISATIRWLERNKLWIVKMLNYSSQYLELEIQSPDGGVSIAITISQPPESSNFNFERQTVLSKLEIRIDGSNYALEFLSHHKKQLLNLEVARQESRYLWEISCGGELLDLFRKIDSYLAFSGQNRIFNLPS